MNLNLPAELVAFLGPTQVLLDHLPPVLFLESECFHDDLVLAYKNSRIPRHCAEALLREARNRLERFLWEQNVECLVAIAAKLDPQFPPCGEENLNDFRFKRRLVAIAIVPLLGSYVDYFGFLRAVEETEDSEFPAE